MRELTVSEQESVGGGVPLVAGIVAAGALGGVIGGFNYTMNSAFNGTWSYGGFAGSIVQGGVVGSLTAVAGIAALTPGGAVAAVSVGGGAALISSVGSLQVGNSDDDS